MSQEWPPAQQPQGVPPGYPQQPPPPPQFAPPPAPPQPGYPGYPGQPPQYGAPVYPGQQPGYGMPPQVPQKKSHTSLIVTVAVLLVVGLGVGLFLGLKGSGGGSSNASASSSPGATGAPGGGLPGGVPGGQPSAASTGGGGGGGGGGGTGSPQAVVTSLIQAMKAGSVSQATPLLCQSLATGMPASLPPDPTFATFKIHDTTSGPAADGNGTEWLVSVDAYDAQGTFSGYTFHVEKENGAYKVCSREGPFSG